MMPALLITFREVIEATLIVATIMGILVKLKQNKSIKTVWLATAVATILSLGILTGGALLGFKVHEFYAGKTKEIFEGMTMLISAIFISWAVFWLHTYFARHKLVLLQKVKQTLGKDEQRGVFLLVFTAVFREGMEIILFLSTVYITSRPAEVLAGFGLGMSAAMLAAMLLFSTTIRLPLFRAFQVTTVLLILFAAGLAAQGAAALSDAGVLPQIPLLTIAFLPPNGHIAADIIKAVFGLSRNMDYLQLSLYAGYIAFMRWYVYGRRSVASPVTTYD